jgi:hypothetical protein
VWEATHSESNLRVAVKVFDQGSRDKRQAHREVRILSRVVHPSVLQAFEVVETRVKTALAGGGDAPLDERTLPGDKGATLEAVLPHSKHRREDHATLVGFEEKEIAVGADKEEARA